MRILIVMEGYFPGEKYGGPPVSINNFCSLMSEHDIYILTRNHDLGETLPYTGICEGWNFRQNCRIKYLNDNDYNKDSFEAAILEVKPDRIYLQGLFQSCIFSCLCLAKKHNIQVILAPRGELCKGAMRKKYKKVPYILFFHMLGLWEGAIYQSTSAEESLAIKKWLKSPIDRIFLVENIPSIRTDITRADKGKKRKGIAELVFISRIHPKKNLLLAIQCINRVRGNVKFDIYGPIEDDAYWKKCISEINQSPHNVDIQYCGIVNHDSIHETFSNYDAFIFPTLSENYGHAIVESLQSGCPVVTSDCTPWTDLEANSAGWTIPLADGNAYVDAIQKIIDCESNIYSNGAIRYIANKVDLHSIREKYNKLLSSEI